MARVMERAVVIGVVLTPYRYLTPGQVARAGHASTRDLPSYEEKNTSYFVTPHKKIVPLSEAVVFLVC